MKLTKNDIDEITHIDIPRGQKLTSKYKKNVYIINRGKFEGYVFKGPWCKDNTRIKNMKFKIKCIKRLNITSVCLPKICKDYNNEIWFRYNNLATTDSSNWTFKMVSSKIQPIPFKIIDRTSLGYNLLSNLDLNKQYKILFGKEMLFKIFILMAFLGIGDMGPWNVIVTNNKSFIIDIDDNSTRRNINEPKHIFSKIGNKEQIEMINRGFKKKKKELEKFYQLLGRYINKFSRYAVKYNVKIDLINNYNMISNLFIK